MSFDPLTETEPAAASSAITASRQKRQLERLTFESEWNGEQQLTAISPTRQ